MPDSFTDIEKVTRSHIQAANVLARLVIPKKGTKAVLSIPKTGIGAMLCDGADATTMHDDGFEAVTPQKMRGRSPSSISNSPKKNASLAQLTNPSHEIILDFDQWGTPQSIHKEYRDLYKCT